jgi:hypothetical protein
MTTGVMAPPHGPVRLRYVSGAISRGAGLLRLILDVAALVAVGTWVALREGERISQA